MTTTIKLTALAISTMSIALFATRTTTVCGDKTTAKPFMREVAKAFLVDRALQRAEVAAKEVAEALDGRHTASAHLAETGSDRGNDQHVPRYSRALRIQQESYLTGFMLPW